MKITIFKIDKGIERLRARQARRWALEARVEASTYIRMAGATYKKVLAEAKMLPARKFGVLRQLNQARVSLKDAICCYQNAGDPEKRRLSEEDYDLMAQKFKESSSKSQESLRASEKAQQMLRPGKVELN